MKIKVPFKKGIIYREKDVNFEFNIAALEGSCDDLKIEFWQMSESDPFDFAMAVLYNAYKQGCKNPKRPKYSFHHAVFWNQTMSKESQEIVQSEMSKLMGRLVSATKGKVKKK